MMDDTMKTLIERMNRQLESQLWTSTTAAPETPPKSVSEMMAEWSGIMKQAKAARGEFPEAPWGGLNIIIADKQQQRRTPYHTVNVTPRVRTRKDGRKCSRRQAKRLRGMVRARNYDEPKDMLKTPSGYIVTPRQAQSLRAHTVPTPSAYGAFNSYDGRLCR